METSDHKNDAELKASFYNNGNTNKETMITRGIATAATLLITTTLGFGQSNNIDLLRNENLVYQWAGRGCPRFNDTNTIYGFKIECCGCALTRKIERNNRKVIKQVERVYGKNWFALNRNKFLALSSPYGYQ